jgi:hypothetical protein
MIKLLGMPKARARECLLLPAVLTRSGVLVLILAFTLVLTRWGYDAQTCLLLLSGVSVAALRLGQGLLRPLPSRGGLFSLRSV